jgi:hypothetical protein
MQVSWETASLELDDIVSVVAGYYRSRWQGEAKGAGEVEGPSLSIPNFSLRAMASLGEQLGVPTEVVCRRFEAAVRELRSVLLLTTAE